MYRTVHRWCIGSVLVVYQPYIDGVSVVHRPYIGGVRLYIGYYIGKCIVPISECIASMSGSVSAVHRLYIVLCTAQAYCAVYRQYSLSSVLGPQNRQNKLARLPGMDGFGEIELVVVTELWENCPSYEPYDIYESCPLA